MVTKKQNSGRVRPFPARKAAVAFFSVALLLAVGVARPTAQELSDEELAQTLETVILERTQSPNTLEEVVEIPVTQDTYIASNNPDLNYGRAGELRLGYNVARDHDGALRPFTAFDIAGNIPSGAVIGSATLWAYVFAASPAEDEPMGTIGRHLLNSWDADLVTWDSHQPNWGTVFGRG